MTAASFEFATAGRIMAGAGRAGDIASQALTSSSMQGNPVPLSQDELEAVVRRAL